MYYYHIISSRANICEMWYRECAHKAVIWGKRETQQATISIEPSGIFGKSIVPIVICLRRYPFPLRSFSTVALRLLSHEDIIPVSFSISFLIYISLSLSLSLPTVRRPYSWRVSFPGSYGAKTVKSCTRSQISYLEFLTVRSTIISWRLPRCRALPSLPCGVCLQIEVANI